MPPMVPRTKFEAAHSALLAGEHLWEPTYLPPPTRPNGFSRSSSSSSSLAPPAPTSPSRPSFVSGKSSSVPRARWFADLLVLPVDHARFQRLASDVSTRELLDDEPGSKGSRIRENVGALWRECLRVWRNESGEDADRVWNAVDTLFAISSLVLSRRLPNYTLDVINILCGSMDEADEQLESLVLALEATLRGTSNNSFSSPSLAEEEEQYDPATLTPTARPRPAVLPALRLKALQLGLLFLSNVHSTSLGAYFLRRDLFSASLLTLRQVGGSAEDFGCLVSLLVQLGQGGSGAGGMGIGPRLISAAAASGTSPYGRRVREWRDVQAIKVLAWSFADSLEGAVDVYEGLVVDGGSRGAGERGTPTGGDTPTTTANSWLNPSSLVGAVTGAFSSAATIGGAATSVEKTSPPPSTSLLFPLLILSRTNADFVRILSGRDHDDTTTLDDAPLLFALLSLASYTCAHGSADGARSRTYARLGMLNVLSVLGDTKGCAALLAPGASSTGGGADGATERLGEQKQDAGGEEGGLPKPSLKICRQKLPSLAQRKEDRPLVGAAIDVGVLYLRHNRSKSIDVLGMRLALGLVRLVFVKLSFARLTLEHAWEEVWDAILGLAAFVVGRKDELRPVGLGSGADVRTLAIEVIDTLDAALVLSDRFLPSVQATRHLVFELARSSQLLRSLALLTASDGSGLIKAAGWTNVERVLDAVERGVADHSSGKRSTKGGAAGISGTPSQDVSKGMLGSFGSSVAKLWWPSSSTASSAPVPASPALDSPKSPSTPSWTQASASASRLDVATVLSIIAESADLERLLQPLGGGLGAPSKAPSLSSPSSAGQALETDHHLAQLRGQLDAVEAACLPEAVRVAAKDFLERMGV